MSEVHTGLRGGLAKKTTGKVDTSESQNKEYNESERKAGDKH